MPKGKKKAAVEVVINEAKARGYRPRRQAPSGDSLRYARALTDPFGVRGEKIPDLVAQPSATCCSLDAPLVTTDAAGKFAYRLVLHGPGRLVESGAIAAGTVTWSLVAASNNASIAASCIAIRPVSGGISFVPSTGVTTGSGQFVICAAPASTSNVTSTSTESELAYGADMCVVSAQDSFEAHWRPQDFVSFDYFSVTDTAYAIGWPTVTVYGFGLPASATIGRLIVTANWEAIASAALTSILSMSPPRISLRELEVAARVCGGLDFVTNVTFVGPVGAGILSPADALANVPTLGAVVPYQSSASAATNRPGIWSTAAGIATAALTNNSEYLSSVVGDYMKHYLSQRTHEAPREKMRQILAVD